VDSKQGAVLQASGWAEAEVFPSVRKPASYEMLYRGLAQTFFGNYHHVYVNVGKDNVFRLIVENMSSLEACKGNGVMGVNCATQNFYLSKTVFPNCIINIFGLLGRHTSPISNVLIVSAIQVYLMSDLLEASCYTSHHLVVVGRKDYQ
jgi:hypothetical protein